MLGIAGACLFIGGSAVLGFLDQDTGRHDFGDSGGNSVLRKKLPFHLDSHFYLSFLFASIKSFDCDA
jgi:hypothetical protein